MSYVRAATAVALTVFALTACGTVEKTKAEVVDRSEQVAAESLEKQVAKEMGADVDDVSVDSKTGTITVTGPEGTLLIGEDLALPAGWPRVVPLPGGSHTINSVHVKKAGGFNVTALRAGVSVEQQALATAADLTAAGFQVSGPTASGANRTLHAQRRGLTVALMVSAPNASQVAVNYDVVRSR